MTTEMIKYLYSEVPKVLPFGYSAFLAGSILFPAKFRPDSDVDVFLRGPRIEHLDLTDFIDLSLRFMGKFDRFLHIYPTNDFKSEPQQEILAGNGVNKEKETIRAYCAHRVDTGYPLAETLLPLRFLRNCLWMVDGEHSGFAFCQRENLLRALERINRGEEEWEIGFDTWIARQFTHPYRPKKLQWVDYEDFASFLAEEFEGSE